MNIYTNLPNITSLNELYPSTVYETFSEKQTPHRGWLTFVTFSECRFCCKMQVCKHKDHTHTLDDRQLYMSDQMLVALNLPQGILSKDYHKSNWGNKICGIYPSGRKSKGYQQITVVVIDVVVGISHKSSAQNFISTLFYVLLGQKTLSKCLSMSKLSWLSMGVYLYQSKSLMPCCLQAKETRGTVEGNSQQKTCKCTWQTWFSSWWGWMNKRELSRNANV